MDIQALDQKIQECGRQFFASIRGEAPSIFNKGWWTGKVMDWSMRNEDFKVKMFRFVDVLPYLSTSESLTRHIEEYFAGEGGELPPVMSVGMKAAGLAGKLGTSLMAKTIRTNIEGMARQFIVGEDAAETVKGLARLRKDGFSFTLDVLGEATVSEKEADERLTEHLALVDAMAKAQGGWPALGEQGSLDWGCEPRINLSIKPTAFCSQLKSRDVEGSVAGLYARIAPLLAKVREAGGFLCLDMGRWSTRRSRWPCIGSYARPRTSGTIRILESCCKRTCATASWTPGACWPGPARRSSPSPCGSSKEPTGITKR
jgi:RHH-type transcriptional regulator, proline utilization regulon repressor / proline dehydrogenase / delta 1-pyrroline-5-carboxylate dehydrogenase